MEMMGLIRLMERIMYTLIPKEESRDFFLRLHRFHKGKKKLVNEKGQSTIEFLATFAITFPLLFIFLKIALNYVTGYVVHYGTYMSARHYMVHDTRVHRVYSSEDHVREIFDSFKIDSFNFGQRSDFEVTISDPKEGGIYTGVITKYTDTFTFSKAFGGAKTTSFISEAYLGKSVSVKECEIRICKAFVKNNDTLCSSTSSPNFQTYFDNGC